MVAVLILKSIFYFDNFGDMIFSPLMYIFRFKCSCIALRMFSFYLDNFVL